MGVTSSLSEYKSKTVSTDTDQVISGIKTFSSNTILFPSGTIDNIHMGSDISTSNSTEIAIGRDISTLCGTSIYRSIIIGTQLQETNRNLENLENIPNVIIGSGPELNSKTVVNGAGNISLGVNANISANNAIQLGSGTNNTSNTFQVFDYQLLDANGKIPAERLPETSSGDYVTTDTDQTITSVKTISDGSSLDFEKHIILSSHINTDYNGIIAIGDVDETSRGSFRNIIIGNGKLYDDACDTIRIGSGHPTNQIATHGDNAIFIGQSSYTTNYNARQIIAIGCNARTSAEYCIQLGMGTNNTPNTFQVWDYNMLNQDTGLIPDERISENILKTIEQSLTAEQVTQVKTNLGLTDEISDIQTSITQLQEDINGVSDMLGDTEDLEV